MGSRWEKLATTRMDAVEAQKPRGYDSYKRGSRNKSTEF